MTLGLLGLVGGLTKLGFAAGWLEEDPLYRQERETKAILREYERTGEAGKVLHWITGSRIGTQGMMTLGEWAVDHQFEFLELTSRLRPEQQQEFVESFYSAVPERHAFVRAYEGRRSPVLDRIVMLLR
ncbi:MAG TPA: hypothetical protein VK689_21510 [Armatimonadota bacterium]|nr:hypothetical protein [Armatimonadota bacterium]